MNPNVQTRFKARQNFTQEDWAELDSRNNEAEFAELLNETELANNALLYFINLFKSVLDRLLAGGIITYEDSEGRCVVYDGKDVSNNGTIHPEILMNNITSWQFPYKGVVVLGGSGNDMLYGTEYPVHPDGSPNPYLYPCPDYLYGGAGNDTLDGGTGKGFGGSNGTGKSVKSFEFRREPAYDSSRLPLSGRNSPRLPWKTSRARLWRPSPRFSCSSVARRWASS